MSQQTGQTQQMLFVSQVLPSLFHHTPDLFIQYLERDGNKFLRFYWDEAGKKLNAAQRMSSFGLNYAIHTPYSHTTIILISLPEPKVDGEAWFAALIFRPLRVTPFLMISDTTKFIALVRTPGKEGKLGAVLQEWDRHLKPEAVGSLPEPNREEFYKAVRELVKPG